MTVRIIFHLPLRQTEGFLRSLADTLGLHIPIPDHTTLSRRARRLDTLPICAFACNRRIHLLIDSTGLRIHVGHRAKVPKRRAWRKLHLAVDSETGDIVASDLGSHRARDASRVPALLEQIETPLASARADGAYDTQGVYESIQARGEGRRVRIFIPPSRDAQLSPRPSAALKERNRNIRSIRRLGRRQWHQRSGYSRRSMAENTICRYKRIIEREIRARTLAGQRAEMRIACRVLNLMSHLGMPRSYRAR